MIVATAGHVDHGKTALVRALTGVDTDRLPEEKRRGISIDLGFAFLQTACGNSIAFVDVPGHERFVRNMIAGVAAIDAGLLVVAADDGVMPQTREHLDILELLGVPSGIVAITKTDRVDAARIHDVEREVTALLAGRSWRPAAILAISALRLTGLDELRAALLDMQRHAGARDRHLDRAFRFIVDRSFIAPGSGTVVTGTVVSGRVEAGTSLILSPAGTRVRVRGIEQNRHAVNVARAGERCAVNLVGVERSEVGRGDYLLAERLHAPTQRLDVEIRLVHDATKRLAHWTPVHLHIGTGDVLARVVTSPKASIAPGEPTFAQLILQEPVAAFTGDRFLLRDQSARTTIAGGTVVDPFAPARRRRVDATPRLAALTRPTPEAALHALVRCTPDGVDASAFGRRFALADTALQRLLQQPSIILLRGRTLLAFEADAIAALAKRIVEKLGEYHQSFPWELGIAVAELHRRAACPFDARNFESLLRKLAARGVVDVVRECVALPTHRPKRRDDAQQFLVDVTPELVRARYTGLRVAELAAFARVDADVATRHLAQLLSTGNVVRFREDRYLLSSTIDEAARAARALARANGGSFSAAQFRDHAGIGRNLTIELLELLDRRGITSRIGNARHLRETGMPLGGNVGGSVSALLGESAIEHGARRP
jgi:selenocysteine-specific elongation factor